MGKTTLEETGGPDAPADGHSVWNRPHAATPSPEEKAFAERRRRLGIADGAPRIGLALSGGGIRSATFCLGLLRGLARQGVLPRFDYLSTVSGGGYVGAMFGRLVQRVGIVQAQAILADSDSRPLWWLRRYGRYLAPGGARDYGIGIATFLRAFLAVHVEFAFLALATGLATVFLHALHARTVAFGHTGWHEWKSALWPLAVIVWLLLAPGLMGAYWMLRDPPRTAAGIARDARFRPWDAGVACASAVAGGVLLGGLWSADTAIVPPPSIRLWMGCMLSGLGVSGLVLAFRLWRRRLDIAAKTVAEARRDLTTLLRAVNLVSATLVLLGVLDWASWELHEAIQQSRLGLFGGLGTGGALLVAARAANEPLQKWMRPEAGASRNLLPLVVNALGFGLAFALLVLWTTVVQSLVFDVPTFGRCPEAMPAAVCSALGAWPEIGALWRWATLCGLLVVWFVCTGSNAESANTTSLHNMYAARLVRAYLGSVNPARFADDRLDGGTAGIAVPDVPVTEIENDDDPALATYRPDEHGGPLHLVNVCLNQTRGRQTRLYNADRKGVPMTVSAYAADVDGAPVPGLPVDMLGKLGRWVAISGAAASPGAGAYTSPGWSALLFLGGARLGYWLRVGNLLCPAPVVDGAWRRPWRYLVDAIVASKIGRLSAEFSARFDGPFTPDWYLSDGGHFDNTGVHALLGRRLDFIVLADCGSDPDYRFADLENLVRKARIDHGAEIEFYSAESAAAFFTDAGTSMHILAPEQMADNFTSRGVLLARILYKAATDGSRKQGTLLVVKPNLHAALDVDVLAYARRNPRFPQQTTGDQFFDEAQWESYHRLGEDFGSHLRIDWLSQLPAWTTTIDWRKPPERVRTCPLVPASAASGVSRPFWRIDSGQAAVGALSLGAALTLIVPASQALDALRTKREKDREELGRLVVEAADGLLAASPATGAGRDLRQRFLIIRLMSLAEKVPWNSEESAAAYELIQESVAKCDVSKPHSVICEEIRNQLKEDSRSRDEYWATASLLTASAESGAAAPEKIAIAGSAPSPGQGGPPRPPFPSTSVASVRSSASPAFPGHATTLSVDSACDGIVLYVQIYDEATRGRLRRFEWDSIEPPVSMPGIENVNLTAAARNDRPPRPYAVPTIIVHDYDKDAECAGALRGWLGSQQTVHAEPGGGKTWPAGEMSIRRLPSGLSGERHVIELWWPPASNRLPAALSP